MSWRTFAHLNLISFCQARVKVHYRLDGEWRRTWEYRGCNTGCSGATAMHRKWDILGFHSGFSSTNYCGWPC